MFDKLKGFKKFLPKITIEKPRRKLIGKPIIKKVKVDVEWFKNLKGKILPNKKNKKAVVVKVVKKTKSPFDLE